jgi:hypothetical protein
MSDPMGELAWLEKELQEVETMGGLALLVGHIPPDELMHECAYRLRAIEQRY